MAFGWKRKTAEFEAEALPHLRDLFRAASGLLGSAAQAEDLIQEVYLRAWRSYDDYQRGTNCRAWLYTIMINCVRDHRRRAGGERVVHEDPAVLESRVADSSSTEGRLHNEEILEAVGRLPLKYREVVLLADVEGLSYKEIASMVGVPLGTVMSRLSRARGILRSHLAGVAESFGFETGDKRGQVP